MKKNKKIILRSVLLAAIGAVVLVYAVLTIHNKLICDNQYKNNHEKLELIESKIDQSKDDEDYITSVYDEMYQSKADSLAFQLRYITDIDLNDKYAEEMRAVYGIDYLCVKDNDEIIASAGEILSSDFREYSATISDNKTIYIQLNNSSLNENIEQNASLTSTLSNISVGQSGYILAFHTVKKTVLFSPNAGDIGRYASEFGVDVDSLQDGQDLKLTYDGIVYLASCKKIDHGMIVTVVPYSEITANDMHTMAISLTVYLIFIVIIILYSIFVKEDSIYHKEEQDPKKIINKNLASIVLIGTLLSFGFCFYMNTLFTLSEQSITNENRDKELIDALNKNASTLIRQEKEYNEQYSQKLDELAYIIKNVDPSYLTRSFMSELRDVLKVNSVMYYDLDGNTIAANTDNWSYSISKDPNDQSYDYWQILNGSKTVLIQDAQINDNGNLRQYMGKAIQDENYRTIGMVSMSVTPEQIENSKINTDTQTVLASVSTGNNGFAFAVSKPDDNGNSTFVYFPKSTLIGKDVTSYGMNSTQLVSDYNDFIKIDGTNYYCASGYYGDMITYIAVPFSSLNITALPISITTALVMVVFMSLIWLTYEERESDDGKEKDENKEAQQVDVVMSNGRIAKARSVIFRWTHGGITWESMTAGQKTTHVFHVVLTIMAFVVLSLVIFKDSFFDDDSLFRFILSTRWQKGINIFSISYCIVIVICSIEISLIVRKVIMWIAHTLNAKGETVCRMFDNFIKFAVVIGLFYFTSSALGANTSALVTSASILTLVIGLGSQSLIGDVLAGLFIVFEGEFQVGDIVTIDGFRGTVVEIGIRTTKVKEGTGNVKIFSNSSVKNVLNMTKDYSYVAIDMSIGYDEDLRYVEKVLKEEFPNIKAKLPAIVEGPFYRGVSEFADSAVIIKIIAKCQEQDRIQLDRDLRRRLKFVFDNHNINIPFPQIVINQPSDTVHETTHFENRQAESFVKEQNKEFKEAGIKEE